MEPTGEHTVFSSPQLQFAAVEVELLLGLWLLSGWSPRAAWGAALALFVLLAGISLYLALAGQRSCGCFGEVSVNPWYTFGLDATAAAALLVWRPRGPILEASTGWITSVSRAAAGTLLMFALVVGGAVAFYGSPADALASLRGESITLDPSVSDIGDGEAGESRTFRLQLTNRTSKDIRVVGGTTTCSCIATEDLPVTLPPGQPTSISVRVLFRGGTGAFQHRFLLYTDDPKQGVVVARFSGRVVERLAP